MITAPKTFVRLRTAQGVRLYISLRHLVLVRVQQNSGDQPPSLILTLHGQANPVELTGSRSLAALRQALLLSERFLIINDKAGHPLLYLSLKHIVRVEENSTSTGLIMTVHGQADQLEVNGPLTLNMITEALDGRIFT